MDLKLKTRIIFDFDKTIATLKIQWDNWFIGIAKVIQEFDSNFPLPKPGEFVYYSTQNEYIDKFGKPLVDKIITFNQAFEQENNQGLIPNISCINFINSLKDKELFIWSSNSQKMIEESLEELDLKDRFVDIISRDRVFKTKPDPEGFTHIYNPEHDLKDYLFVGDSSMDEVAAKESRIDFIHVSKLDSLNIN